MKSAVAGFVRSDAEANAGSRGTGSTSGSSAFLSLVRACFTRGRLSLDDSDQPREEPSAGKPHARICGGEAEWPSYPTIPFCTRSTEEYRYDCGTGILREFFRGPCSWS